MDPQKKNRKKVTRIKPSLKIMTIENQIYKKYGVDCRLDPETWQRMIEDIAESIIKVPGLVESITIEDLDALTDQNFHTGRLGAEKALRKVLL